MYIIHLYRVPCSDLKLKLNRLWCQNSLSIYIFCHFEHHVWCEDKAHTASVGSIFQGLIPKNVNGLLVKYCPLKCLESHKNSEDSYKTLDKNN